MICGWAVGTQQQSLIALPLSPLGGANPRLPERETLSWALTVCGDVESHTHAHGERKREEGRGFPRGDLFLRPELESGEKEGKGEGVSPFCATLFFALLQCRPPFSSGIEFPLSTLFIYSEFVICSFNPKNHEILFTKKGNTTFLFLGESLAGRNGGKGFEGKSVFFIFLDLGKRGYGVGLKIRLLRHCTPSAGLRFEWNGPPG